MNEQLTAEDFEALERLPVYGSPANTAIYMGLAKNGYAQFNVRGYIPSNYSWYITESGRKALATYKAQRDLVLFIAEFEEWLEVSARQAHRDYMNGRATINWDVAFGTVLKKYRKCKQRIEPSHEAQ